ALDDEQRGGLAAPAIAARRLGGVEAVEQALGQRSPAGRLEGGGERLDRLLRDEDVALGRVARPRPAAGPVEAARAGVARAPALRVDDAELALGAALVRGGQLRDDLLGRKPLPQQREALRAVAGIRVRLRGNGSHVRLGPGDDRAD